MAELSGWDTCESCMAQCPHQSKNKLYCDIGCPKFCSYRKERKLPPLKKPQEVYIKDPKKEFGTKDKESVN